MAEQTGRVVDVVVVGGGNAALTAGLAAREGGAQVVLLEKAPIPERGGNSFFTAGGFRLAHGGLEDLRQDILTDLSPEEAVSIELAPYAAHALSLAALRRAGYRPANRYIVFQALPHTLGVGPEVWRVLAKCHDVRNRGEYEGDLYVDERLLADLIGACKSVAAALDQLRPI